MFTNNRGWIFLTIVSMFFLILGQSLWGRQGLLLGFLVASVLNFYIYFLSEKIAIGFFKAQQIKGQDCWGVTQAMQKVSDHFHTHPPKVYLTHIDSPMVFCVSRGWGQSKIIISESLLNKLSPDEIQDLLMMHVFYLVSLNSFFIGSRIQFAEIIYIISKFFDTMISLLFLLQEEKKRVFFFQKLFLPIGTVFFESPRKVLLKADEQVARLIGSNERYAKLLWKLQSLVQTKPFPTPPSPSLLFATNPLTTDGLEKYFQKHYELDIRIKNLLGHYPI